jgi:hypothetical protein
MKKTKKTIDRTGIGGRKPETDRTLIRDRKITFLVTESNYNLLHNIAKMEKTTLSAIITNALEEKMKYYVNKNQNKLEFELTQK